MSKRHRRNTHQPKLDQQTSRRLLVEAVKLAEKNILTLIQSGKARPLDDAFNALTALVIHTGFVVDGRTTQMSMNDIMNMQQFIVTSEDYTPSADFPFTKEQLRQAYEAV